MSMEHTTLSPVPAYYRRTLSDGSSQLFPAGPNGEMPVFPGTAQGYKVEPVTGYTPYYGAGAQNTTLYLPPFGCTSHG